MLVLTAKAYVFDGTVRSMKAFFTCSFYFRLPTSFASLLRVIGDVKRLPSKDSCRRARRRRCRPTTGSPVTGPSSLAEELSRSPLEVVSFAESIARGSLLFALWPEHQSHRQGLITRQTYKGLSLY